jgi:hypothetical protein
MKASWTPAEKAVFKRLTHPLKVQAELDRLPYNVGPLTHSPRQVLLRQEAHCFDGAIFAACALEQLGFAPLLMDLRCDGLNDDDHVLAVFRRRGLWGALGKSNYTGCRYRDPVFRSLRELAMSYFNVYFNLAGLKTLREYSLPLDLRRVTEIDWRYSPDDLTPLSDTLNGLRHFDLVPKHVIKYLARADDRLFRAETLGLDARGAFKIRGSRLV